MESALQVSLQRYYRALRIELDRCGADIAAYRRVHAENFSVFDYIEADENRLSDIFADLLDPNGHHGQGERFLELLVERLRISLPSHCQTPRVNREELTTYLSNSRRRIDILIDCE